MFQGAIFHTAIFQLDLEVILLFNPARSNLELNSPLFHGPMELLFSSQLHLGRPRLMLVHVRKRDAWYAARSSNQQLAQRPAPFEPHPIVIIRRFCR